MTLQLGHVYPSPGAPLSEQVIIDLSENPQELTTAEGDVYPLIFRLETISDKGLADGHVLEVIADARVSHLCFEKRLYMWSLVFTQPVSLSWLSPDVAAIEVPYV